MTVAKSPATGRQAVSTHFNKLAIYAAPENTVFTVVLSCVQFNFFNLSVAETNFLTNKQIFSLLVERFFSGFTWK